MFSDKLFEKISGFLSSIGYSDSFFLSNGNPLAFNFIDELYKFDEKFNLFIETVQEIYAETSLRLKLSDSDFLVKICDYHLPENNSTIDLIFNYLIDGFYFTRLGDKILGPKSSDYSERSLYLSLGVSKIIFDNYFDVRFKLPFLGEFNNDHPHELEFLREHEKKASTLSFNTGLISGRIIASKAILISKLPEKVMLEITPFFTSMFSRKLGELYSHNLLKNNRLIIEKLSE